MDLSYVIILFQLIAFLFAISVHESAHAWTAWKLGDPTAQMLGRITLNPVRHIDPVGTVILPALLMFSGLPVFGWAKPVPVNPRNFSSEMRDDILTSVAGPVSNFLVVFGAMMVLSLIGLLSPTGRVLIYNLAYFGAPTDTSSVLMPVVLLLYQFIIINVILAVFNLIPVPPLDGSHVLRHLLPDNARRMYDMAGIALLLMLVVFGGPLIRALVRPVLHFFNSILVSM
jgi:Zn-dependent protease